MKKLIALLLALVMVLGLVACGSSICLIPLPFHYMVIFTTGLAAMI